MKTILIIDDEIQMQTLISLCLEGEDYQLETASSGKEALSFLEHQSYDLLLLDVMMPKMSGFKVLEAIRAQNKSVPVIMLTALGETEDVVKGLNAGADDYIVKPFEPKELRARIQSVLRRFEKTTPSETRSPFGLKLQQDKMLFTFNGKSIAFTKKEYHIFLRLFTSPGQVYTRDQLLELEWDIVDERLDRSVDTHIKNIREKLAEVGLDKRIVETVWGIGYKLSQSEVTNEDFN